MSARVLLAEAQERVREGLRAVIEGAPGLDLVGEATDGGGALDLAASLAPDVAVVDLGLTAPDGLQTTRRLRRAHPDLVIVALSNLADERYLEAVEAAGADALVLKARAGEQLPPSILAALGPQPGAEEARGMSAEGPVDEPTEQTHGATPMGVEACADPVDGESSRSRLNTASQPEIHKSSPAGTGAHRQTEGRQHMELLEALRSDVEGLYERVTGEAFPREQFTQVAAPLPPQVEPITYLRQELEQLKVLVDQRLNPEANPMLNRWLPVADVVAEDDRYTVRVELPGMSKQDIKLAIGDNVIRVEGERKLNLPPATQVVTCERVYGPFERWITFPFHIDKSDMSIRFENGILEISVTRVEHPLGNLESVNFS